MRGQAWRAEEGQRLWSNSRSVCMARNQQRQKAKGVMCLVLMCCCCADSDGFFHTGDVGELTAAGTLKVVDRIKNMFKLAQGEYIAAEHLENKYT